MCKNHCGVIRLILIKKTVENTQKLQNVKKLQKINLVTKKKTLPVNHNSHVPSFIRQSQKFGLNNAFFTVQLTEDFRRVHKYWKKKPFRNSIYHQLYIQLLKIREDFISYFGITCHLKRLFLYLSLYQPVLIFTLAIFIASTMHHLCVLCSKQVHGWRRNKGRQISFGKSFITLFTVASLFTFLFCTGTILCRIKYHQTILFSLLLFASVKFEHTAT